MPPFHNRTEYVLTMPDMFMSRNSTSGFYWIEAKTHSKDDTRLIIDKKNFDDYTMCLNPNKDGFYDIFWCDIRSLIDNTPKEIILFENPVYVWQVEKVMSKLNRYPIDVEKYK